MLVGTFEILLDGSRIVLPRAIFKELSSREVLMFFDSQHGEIVLYGKDSSEVLKRNLPLTPDVMSKKLARMLARGYQSTVDKKRRLFIPEEFRRKIFSSRKCYLVGQGQYCVLKADPHV